MLRVIFVALATLGLRNVIVALYSGEIKAIRSPALVSRQKESQKFTIALSLNIAFILLMFFLAFIV